MTELQKSIARLQESMAASRQQKIANAVRRVPEWVHKRAAEFIVDMDDMGMSPAATLAAACHDDAIWDALAQVRQVIVLERGR